MTEEFIFSTSPCPKTWIIIATFRNCHPNFATTVVEAQQRTWSSIIHLNLLGKNSTDKPSWPVVTDRPVVVVSQPQGGQDRTGHQHDVTPLPPGTARWHKTHKVQLSWELYELSELYDFSGLAGVLSLLPSLQSACVSRPLELVGDLDNCHIFYQCDINPQPRSCGDMLFNTLSQVRFPCCYGIDLCGSIVRFNQSEQSISKSRSMRVEHSGLVRAWCCRFVTGRVKSCRSDQSVERKPSWDWSIVPSTDRGRAGWGLSIVLSWSISGLSGWWGTMVREIQTPPGDTELPRTPTPSERRW